MAIDPQLRDYLARTDPAYLARIEARLARLEEDGRRNDFAAAFGVRPMRWGGYNITRMLRHTGERPERIAEAWALLEALGMRDRQWPSEWGVFDHGDLWGWGRVPLMLVGNPYGIDADERSWLSELARGFPGLRVAIDDRPSYYYERTNHVRVELAELRRPFVKPPSTRHTRAAARAARKAFAGLSASVLPPPEV